MSHFISPSLITTSKASASGSTATVAAEVCTRPCVSVAGTRCTRCTPLSYFNVPYTSAPVTEHTISLKPPAAPSLALDTSNFHPLRSQYLEYIRNKSPANRAASSPPVPPRISSIAFLLSSGSLGTSINFMLSSNSGIRFSQAATSSRAISFISASVSCSSISLLSSKFDSKLAYSLRAAIKSSNSLYSFVNRT